jgi:hypothetical protein
MWCESNKNRCYIPEWPLAEFCADAVLTIPAIVFLGVVGAKHQCRPATDKELQRIPTESPIKEPTLLRYGLLTTSELLVEVFGA